MPPHWKYLCKIANHETPQWLRTRLDPDDMVQETYRKAVAARGVESRYYLRCVLLNTIRNSIRDHRAQCHDLNREAGTVNDEDEERT